jgi:hypothetical protein
MLNHLKGRPNLLLTAVITALSTEIIAVEMQPLPMVEDVGFNALMAYIEPDYKMP